MIKIVDGDLLEAKENIIAHSVNCQGKMGSGIALQVKKKYPEAYEEYMEIHRMVKNPVELLGKAQFVKVGEEKYIANLHTQLYYGYDGQRYSDYEAICNCLVKLRVLAESKKYTVAIPFNMASDRGGADWNVVYAMIESAFRGYENGIVIYKYNK